MKPSYKAKTISGAEREVRGLRKQVVHFIERYEEAHKDRIALAKLAADGHCFYDLLDIYKAKDRRDQILRQWCRLKPDGTPI